MQRMSSRADISRFRASAIVSHRLACRMTSKWRLLSPW
jgi:hypothetical protein